MSRYKSYNKFPKILNLILVIQKPISATFIQLCYKEKRSQ